MSGSISFSQIPPNIRIPLVSVEFDNTQAGVNQQNQVSLLIGQTITAQPAAPVLIASPQQAESLFGTGSILARMAVQYIANDSFGTLWCLPLADDPGAVAATGSISITGTASAAGSLALYIGGQNVPVAVNAGDTAATIAANVVTALDAVPTLPVSAAAAAGVVTLTALNKGTLGNFIDTELNYFGLANNEQTPAGITVAVTPIAGGATDPSLTGVAAILGDTPYDFICSPYTGAAATTALTAMMNNTAGRWSPERLIYGHVWSAAVGTEAALETLGASLNDPHLTIFGYEGGPTPPWEWAAAHIGAIAPASRADPARPNQTLQVTGVLPPLAANRMTKTQWQTLLSGGIAVSSYGQGGTVAVLRSVTTYQVNQFGQPDQSYLDAEMLYTLMAITRQLTAAITQKYPRSKLADNGTPFAAGQAVVTPNILQAEIVAQYADMELNGLVEDASAMAAATIVQRDATDPNRVDVLWAPFLIGGLRVVALKNQFRLVSALTAIQ